MLLDHTTAFSDYQPADFMADFPFSQNADLVKSRVRPKTGGFLPATLVETDAGFVQARSLKAGDKVYTFDGGIQEVRRVKHSVPRLTAMMHVPAGALGNDRDLNLPADQLVALDLDAAEILFDMPVVVAKLVSLAGYKGIIPAMPQRLARVHLEFEEEELIWSECGMLLHSGSETEENAFYQLSLTETRSLVTKETGQTLPHSDADVLPSALNDIFRDTPTVPPLAA